jgi:S1-C subfamily serine protease
MTTHASQVQLHKRAAAAVPAARLLAPAVLGHRLGEPGTAAPRASRLPIAAGAAPERTRRVLAAVQNGSWDPSRATAEDVAALEAVAHAARLHNERQRRAQHAMRALQGLDLGQVRHALVEHDKVLPEAVRSAGEHGSWRAALLERGSAALDRAASDSWDTSWMDEEDLLGLEAIVVAVGRPAILISAGRFDPPPAPWEQLEEHRASIEATLPYVGRIEVRGHPAFDWVATGFVVAPGVLMTNRHVIREFATQQSDRLWQIDPDLEVRVDFAEEFGVTAAVEHRVTKVIAVHRVLDVALLALDDDGQQVGSLPLDKGEHLRPEDPVYVVGYPAADSRRNDPADVQAIFHDLFGVKRLQPGFVRDADSFGQFTHDCSTLGGNSGSCVISLSSGRVVGLHVGGRYGQENHALALRDFARDRRLLERGAQFS